LLPPESPAARRWREQLASWAIPPEIRAAAAASPWDLPVAPFAGRARRQLTAPDGVSYQRALEVLPTGGTVLDVGAGAGAASLALRERAGRIIAVDESPAMLDALRSIAGSAVETIAGRWPDVAPQAPRADVIVCHHVLYNVPDIGPFVTALTAAARTRVVVEVTARHPMAPLNPLWMELHRVQRPSGPVAADALAAIEETGVAPRWTAWQRPAAPMDFDDLAAITCRRLCLGPDRLADVEAALRAQPVDEMRDLVTIWWDTV
jgi:SAM-dependent methyltransferase